MDYSRGKDIRSEFLAGALSILLPFHETSYLQGLIEADVSKNESSEFGVSFAGNAVPTKSSSRIIFQ